MGGGLVGHEVEALAGGGPRGLDLGGVADERDRDGLAAGGRRPRPGQRLGGIPRQAVHVAHLEPALGAGLVDLDDEAHPVVHGHGQRLGAAHPAEPGRERDGAAQGPAEMLARRLGERLERALQDALGPDVDPRARGHLPVHHQAGPLELAEVVPGRPLADQVRVGDQHARRPLVGAQDPDRLAALDQERLVVGEGAQLTDDRIERVPAPRGSSRPAVDDEVVRVLGDLGIQVVHEHPERGFLGPAATGELGAAGRSDGTGAAHRTGSFDAVGGGDAVRLLRQTGDDLLAEAAFPRRLEGHEDGVVLERGVVRVRAAGARPDPGRMATDLRFRVALHAARLLAHGAHRNCRANPGRTRPRTCGAGDGRP